MANNGGRQGGGGGNGQMNEHVEFTVKASVTFPPRLFARLSCVEIVPSPREINYCSVETTTMALVLFLFLTISC